MLKASILLFLAAYLISTKISAQSLMHGIGANIYVLTPKLSPADELYNFTLTATHFSYFPRYTLTENENSSVSIGSPLGIGIGVLSRSGGPSGIAWGVDVPVALDYNMGCKSSPGNEKKFGGYFGAGFGYMYTGWNDGKTGEAISYGPVARTGIRFRSSRAKWNVTLGVFFKHGLEKEKYRTFGFNIIADL